MESVFNVLLDLRFPMEFVTDKYHIVSHTIKQPICADNVSQVTSSLMVNATDYLKTVSPLILKKYA